MGPNHIEPLTDVSDVPYSSTLDTVSNVLDGMRMDGHADRTAGTVRYVTPHGEVVLHTERSERVHADLGQWPWPPPRTHRGAELLSTGPFTVDGITLYGTATIPLAADGPGTAICRIYRSDSRQPVPPAVHDTVVGVLLHLARGFSARPDQGELHQARRRNLAPGRLARLDREIKHLALQLAARRSERDELALTASRSMGGAA